jgi:excisionase family DNA binding protein
MDQVKILEYKPDAARLVSISLRSLERLIAAKEIKVVKLSRRVMVVRSSLEAWARKKAR